MRRRRRPRSPTAGRGRAHLIGLLEGGKIPSRLEGEPRRIRLDDPPARKRRDDAGRLETLGELVVQAQERGMGYFRRIQDIIERYAGITRVGKRVGLDGCTAHTLRHTCADRLLNEVGLSVPEVAEILGHADIKTTMIYLAPHKGRLADRMAAIEG